MAYLILSDRGGEIDRRDLREPMIVGRALECDIAIRDILLSRRHCRIEPLGKDRWVVTDLGSKNGTHISGEAVSRHVLIDGEIFHIGKTQVCFRAGEFVPARWKVPRREARPADPHEALSGTVFGFQAFDMEEDARVSGCPIPRPRPADPQSYRHGMAGDMVSEMASSSWDMMLSEPEFELATKVAPAEVVARNRSIQRARSAATEPAAVARSEAPKPRPAEPQKSRHRLARPLRIAAFLGISYAAVILATLFYLASVY